MVSWDNPAPTLAERATWDQRILARMLAGDELAVDEAYRQYGSYVFGLARRVTTDLHAAEELTQEVFVHLWSEPHRVDLERGSLRSWLGVVCHRRSVDWVRRAERQRRRDQAADTGALLPPDVAEAATAMVTAERVRQAVASLPPDQRVAVELAYFDGLSYREVATHLGIPEGTAKGRLRLALAKLADLLHTEGTP